MQARQEEQERNEYVDSLKNQTADAFDHTRVLFDEADDPSAPIALTNLVDCIADFEAELARPALYSAVEAACVVLKR